MFRTTTVAALVPLAFIAGTTVGPTASLADGPVGDQPLDYRVEHIEQRPTCDDGIQDRVRYDIFGYQWDEDAQAWAAVFEESQYTAWYHYADLTPQQATDMGCLTTLNGRVGELVQQNAALNDRLDNRAHQVKRLQARNGWLRDDTKHLRAKIQRLQHRLHHR